MNNRVRVCVIGPFRVCGPSGEDLTPRGRKACGLLSILAMSRGHSRPRATLQDKLWSDRGADQGASSLRQALSEIRRAFGPYRDCLLSDNRTVGLAAQRVEIDLESPATIGPTDGSPSEPLMLLEGLDIRDREFENWLRDQRRAFEAENSTTTDQEGSGRATGMAVAVGARFDLAASPMIIDGDTSHRPWIRALPPHPSAGQREAFVSRVLSGAIVNGVQEVAAVEVSVVDRDTPGIDLAVDVTQADAGMLAQISLRDAHSHLVLWSGSQVLPRSDGLPVVELALQATANQVIDITLLQLRRIASEGDENSAFILGFEAIQKMFRVGADELRAADSLLKAAFEQKPRGIFLAWRAYLRTFFAGEHRLDAAAQAEEARMLGREALQAEPHNSYVLALCSYVHSFLLYEFHAGHDLAEQSLKYNPGNPLGTAYLGRAKTYLGDYEGGFRLGMKARTLAGPSPYRYTLDFLGGVTAALSGRYLDAIRMEEVARSLEPTYRAPLRYLFALYLKTGDRGRAQEIFDRLRRTEPDFSLRLMRDRSYPTDGLRAVGLLDRVDEEFER